MAKKPEKKENAGKSIPLVKFNATMDCVAALPRNLQTGDKFRIILEMAYDEDTAVQAQHLFKKKFMVALEQISPEDAKDGETGQKHLPLGSEEIV